MPKAPNHPIQIEVLYALTCMLLRKHEIPLYYHLMQGDKEEVYILYTTHNTFATCSKILFLNFVPLSLNIFIDPPNLEYTLSIYT